jgi:hypothetical protein
METGRSNAVPAMAQLHASYACGAGGLASRTAIKIVGLYVGLPAGPQQETAGLQAIFHPAWRRMFPPGLKQYLRGLAAGRRKGNSCTALLYDSP